MITIAKIVVREGVAGVRMLFYDALYGIDTGSRIMLVASNEWIRILVLEQFIKGPTEYTPYIVVLIRTQI